MTNPNAPSGGLPQILRRHPLISYFVLAYALSWLVTLPSVLAEWKVITGDYTLPLALKQWIGPGLAGILMSRVTGEHARLRSSMRQWRVGWLWYLIILAGPPAVILSGIALQPGLLANFHGYTSRVLVSYPFYILAVLIGVGVPEELGWRGFALPRLQQRYGPLWGSLILGVLWVFWHLFFFLLPDHGGGPGADYGAVFTNFAIFGAMVLALNFIFTWVYNHTRGSVLIAALLHSAIDAPQLVWVPLFLSVGMANSTAGERSLDLALLIPTGVIAVLLLLLTRGRLGLQPETGQGALQGQPLK
jgi:uncharacterized protein